MSTFILKIDPIAEIQVYWDWRAPPPDQGWRYESRSSLGVVQSGTLDVDRNDLAAAIRLAVHELGLDLRPDDFGMDHRTDGGCAGWSSWEEEE